ncbi:MAG: hypothetical protein JJE55_06965 [Flavobacteriaceae bacterium]|nr:hypothetical protein [Flavobacteriaceae bacterium]
MIKRDIKNKIVIDPWEELNGIEASCRMHALVALVRNQEESSVDFADIRYAMDMLQDLLPTVDQAELYLLPEEKIRVLTDSTK